MEPILKEILYFTFSYVGLMAFMYITVNFLSKGWLTTFLKVKASRGKKLMVIVNSQTDTYFRVGRFDSTGAFRYVTRDKVKKTLTKISNKNTFPMMGVFCIELDEVKNTVRERTGGMAAAVDPATVDNLIKRIIMAPALRKDLQIVILIVCLLLLAAVCVNIFMGHDSSKQVLAMCSAARVI